MDILNNMTVPELKSVLREYKKVHYQPYSKLNREELIKLIVRHKLHENDLSKHIKVKVKKVRIKPSGIRVVRAKKVRLTKEQYNEMLDKINQMDVEPPAKRKPRRKKQQGGKIT